MSDCSDNIGDYETTCTGTYTVYNIGYIIF